MYPDSRKGVLPARRLRTVTSLPVLLLLGSHSVTDLWVPKTVSLFMLAVLAPKFTLKSVPNTQPIKPLPASGFAHS